MPSALEIITKRTISLLTSDVKTRKLVGVSREGMEEVLNSQHCGGGVGEEIERNVGHLPTSKEEVIELAGSILTSK